MKMRVVVAVGDGRGRVGVGVGKAQEVVDAHRKAVEQAKKNMIRFPLIEGTIPHEVIGRLGSTRVLLKPGAPGTGVIAGGAARLVLKVAGITDVLSKILGSTNRLNVARATIDALQKLKDPREVARIRGKRLEEIWPYPRLPAYALEGSE